jgi:hypothetical protein
MEDLRQMWQQYDEKLQRTQTINEQLLRKLNTRHSADRIERLRNMEYFGLFFLGILVVLFGIRFNALGARWELKASYVLVMLQLVGWLGWSLRKVTFLAKLDMERLSVTDMLSRMSHFRLMLVRERLWGGLSLLLFFLVPCTILVDYWMNGSTGLLTSWKPYVVRIIPALVLGVTAALWLYRKYYLKPIDEVTSNLREIKEFSQP